MRNTNELYGRHYTYMKEVESDILSALQKIIPVPARYSSRIKTTESMSAKLEMDGYPVTAESALTNEADAIGIRVIANSIKDVYAISDSICHSNWNIIKVKDYIKAPKPSGYRSLHIILTAPSKDPEFPVMKAEIQIRTAIMDCWASLEHMALYKQTIPMTEELHDLLALYRKEAAREIQYATAAV